MLGIKKYAVKEEQKSVLDNSNEKIKVGNRMVFTTMKNRYVPEGMTAEAFINFKEGLLPYQGLLEDAVKYGFIEKTGVRWLIKHSGKSVFTKDLYTADVWEPILPELDKKISNDIQYASYGEEMENSLDPSDSDKVDPQN
jgi:hypothetical protein